MNKNPELSVKYLGTITEDFAAVSDTLKEAAYAVRQRGFSDFPIFPICKVDQPIGQLLLASKELNVSWNYNITYLDEFLQRDIISKEMVDEFKANYKDPDEFCCLFVIDNGFTNFVFIPYPED
jgi:hypothetical protein